MKLLVFSDTHGGHERLVETAIAEQPANAVFFLGDGNTDADILQEALPKMPLYTVVGNCDYNHNIPAQGVVPFGGILFFYTHGHLYNAKFSVSPILQAAQNYGASVALYGHTHIASYTCVNGVHLFNPGSLAFPRNGRPSFGIITIEGGVPSFEIKYS